MLTWPVADGRFMGFAQRRITGVLLAVEAIYACATIGLMAIDLFTTTGARMNEVMQIRLTEDCIVRLKMPPPPEAKDQSPRVRYILRLIPKGEKADVPQDYFIGEETKRLFVKVAQMLGDHYGLQPGQALPKCCIRCWERPRPPIWKGAVPVSVWSPAFVRCHDHLMHAFPPARDGV